VETTTVSALSGARFRLLTRRSCLALFVNVPYPSISYIYQSIGCQHVLHHTSNDYAPPSIPALTPRGFVRWESIQTLLSPEEHGPYLRAALNSFPIKHPDTGELFPKDLTAAAFPARADPEIEKWHSSCEEQLRRRASPDGNDAPKLRAQVPPRHRCRAAYGAKIAAGYAASPRNREEGADYFSSRPLRAKNVPSTQSKRPSPAARTAASRPYLSPHDNFPRSPGLRRRSFPDVFSPPVSATTSPVPGGSDTERPVRSADRTRRHSHPRHRRDSTSSCPSVSSHDSDHQTFKASPSSSPTKSRPDMKRAATNIHVTPPTPRASDSNAPKRRRNPHVPNPRDRGAPYKIPDVSGMRHAPSPQGTGRPRSATHGVPQHLRRPSLSTAKKSSDEDHSENDRSRRRRLEGKPNPLHIRSGSHDGRYTPRAIDRTEAYRERHSDRDEKDWERRRRVTSPPKVVEGWKRYIPELLR
jgi:hypothetical protein